MADKDNLTPLEKVKLDIDAWFDTEEGREDLEDLAEYITSCLNDV